MTGPIQVVASQGREMVEVIRPRLRSDEVSGVEGVSEGK